MTKHLITNFNGLLKQIGIEDELSLYEYKPSLLTPPLLVSFEKLTFIRRLRFLYELLHGGYRVYYLVKDGIILGHCVVTPGGRRLKESTHHDIVLGPYFMDSAYRGLGLAKRLVGMTLRYCSYNYTYAYDWIYEGNVASIKTSESLGMEVVGRLSVNGPFRRLVPDRNGSYLIYRFDNKHTEA